jgi:hypothetical protein
MRFHVALFAGSLILLPTPLLSQMLNDEPARAPAGREDGKPVVAPSKSRSAASSPAATDVELPSSSFQPPPAGSPVTAPFDVANPFSGGSTAQSLGIYKALTK